LARQTLITRVHIYCRFRWIHCQLGYLRRCLPGRIRRALCELPETLDETYERALKDIDKSSWELAHRLLQFVAIASRPLRVEELSQFLGFDFTTGTIPQFHEGWLLEDPVDAVLSSTSNLLATVVVNGSLVIQFSHFSVKEFLTSSRLAESNDIILHRYHISLTRAHTLAAQACLGMLLHLDQNIARNDLEKFALAEYAAEHWVDHARFEDVSRILEDGMKQLFDPTEFHFAVWTWIYDLEDQYWRREMRGERPSQPRGTPLHYAALCGFEVMLNFLVVEHSQDVNCRGFEYDSTPLHLASRKGHVKAARVLLDRGAGAEARDKHNSTPLHLASRGGHVEVVRLLFEHGAHITPEDDFGEAPFELAIIGGHVEAGRVFLESDADKIFDEWTPLHQASFDGNIQVMRVLLQRSIDLTGQANVQLSRGSVSRRTCGCYPNSSPVRRTGDGQIR
jgi:ankyrin repeat domain-containing protein 50